MCDAAGLSTVLISNSRLNRQIEGSCATINLLPFKVPLDLVSCSMMRFFPVPLSLFAFVSSLVALSTLCAQPQFPALAPPTLDVPGSRATTFSAEFAPPMAPASQSEWTFHKSADGSRPNGTEQQYVWLMNRARKAPEVEGFWMALIRDSEIRFAISFFSVQLELLRQEFAALSPVPPAAFDIRLHNAAIDHSNYLISIDDQNHNDQFDRITTAGFTLSSARGSVFSYARNGLYGHAGFNIDWGGNDGTGMQTGRGHRAAIMGNYSNVGVGVVQENNQATDVGPEVTTINYCNANTSQPDHHNQFIVGTVWEDTNDNRMYDPGEGIAGVTVQPDIGPYYAVTGDAGGYAIPVDPGDYVVTYTGTGLAQPEVRNITVGSTSVLVEWQHFPAEPVNPMIALSAENSETVANWTFHLGQPSTVGTSLDLNEWEWIDTAIHQSGQTLSWSESWPTGTQRFWIIRTWAY